MSIDCGHGALIASGEAEGRCLLCQKAEIERLEAELYAVLSERNMQASEIERLQEENRRFALMLGALIGKLEPKS